MTTSYSYRVSYSALSDQDILVFRGREFAQFFFLLARRSIFETKAGIARSGLRIDNYFNQDWEKLIGALTKFRALHTNFGPRAMH